MTRETVPAHIWFHEVATKAIKLGAKAGFVEQVAWEITASGLPRISLLANSGETIEDAASLIANMAQGRERANAGLRVIKRTIGK